MDDAMEHIHEDGINPLTVLDPEYAEPDAPSAAQRGGIDEDTDSAQFMEMNGRERLPNEEGFEPFIVGEDLYGAPEGELD
jgi:hypothetical protein